MGRLLPGPLRASLQRGGWGPSQGSESDPPAAPGPTAFGNKKFFLEGKCTSELFVPYRHGPGLRATALRAGGCHPQRRGMVSSDGGLAWRWSKEASG